MKVYSNIDEFQKLGKAVVTTGTFDGVHIGHYKILDRLKEVARNCGGETVLLTFFPHPRMVLYPDSDLELINTQQEKIALLEKAGIDHLIIHPFSKKFSRLSSVTFIRDVLVNSIGTHKLVIGYDHHFGRNREGSFGHLKEYGPLYGFEVEEIPAQDVRDIAVSSTKIRKSLLSGDISTTLAYLNHEFTLQGTVVHGAKKGSSIGFPTANIEIKEPYKIIPGNGVYIVKVFAEGAYYKGMLNIGVRPTVSGIGRTIEVHLFDYNGDLYGKEIQLSLLARIRDEQKFESEQQLIDQLKQDQTHALNFFSK